MNLQHPQRQIILIRKKIVSECSWAVLLCVKEVVYFLTENASDITHTGR